ncbi:Hsp70 family protein [Mastigocladopsis repens]|uniref:Hsp70 family protein n=1 Tax=Mastigocladopsis repens TaxID=221287 RepID=UPI0002EB5116|nr:Hsp70 family protein [Mastigocladopsis repens]
MSEVDVLGIDLGTTNSAIAIWEPDTGQARVLSNSEGDGVQPGYVQVRFVLEKPIGRIPGFSRVTPSGVEYARGAR